MAVSKHGSMVYGHSLDIQPSRHGVGGGAAAAASAAGSSQSIQLVDGLSIVIYPVSSVSRKEAATVYHKPTWPHQILNLSLSRV